MSINNLNNILFEKISSYGSRPFLEFSNRKYSFDEVNRLSHNMAAYLQRLGVRKNDLIGLYLERSENVLIAILGVLKIGAAFLPLDSDYPISRIRYIIHDSKINMLMTDKNLADRLADMNIKVVPINDNASFGAYQNIELNEEKIDDEGTAYVIYTSGSTGNPKGVTIRRNSLANLICSVQKRMNLCEMDLFMSITTICFDISIMELLLPVYVGCRLRISENHLSKDGKKLAAELEMHNVTVMQATPSLWMMLVEAGWKGSDIFTVICGGEALSNKLAEELVERSNCLWNMYGPTETCIWSMMKKMDKSDMIVSLGNALDNTYLYIIDEGQLKNDIGDVGELYIGGIGLSSGYYNHDELNTKAFIRNTYDNRCNIIYKTGDLVRINSNNMIEYIQRVDFQVKIRGFRVELGDIESSAEMIDGVEKAVAVANNTIGDNLALFYVGSENCSKEAVLRFLREKLPEYMIPSFVVKIDEFPMTNNLKVDRKQLSEMSLANIRNESYNTDNSEVSIIQSVLSEIWCDILNLDYVNSDENFLDLGGHSLLINRMTNRVNDEFGIELSILDVIQHGMTIFELENMIESNLISLLNDDELKELNT